MTDESSFESFYHQTAPRLRAYVVRVIGHAAPAEDIVQDAYLRLLRAPPPIHDPDELRAYLFRIASNLIHDHWRRQRREREVSDHTTAAPNMANPDPALKVDMARVFAQLKPQQRQLMWLAYVEGAEHSEIAAALGLRQGSVRVLLHRARHKLASLLRQRETTSAGEPR